MNILIVDDHALFRESVALALAAVPGFSVRHCSSVTEALALISKERFHVVLLDYELGAERGTAFLAGAKRKDFEGRVLVVTAYLGDHEAQRLIREGVAGIFFKSSPMEELKEAIRAVAGGGAWLEQRFLRMVAGAEANDARAKSKALTERERRVLGGVFEGLSNKEIATHLQISEHAVKALIQGLFGKTGARTRGQLVRVALERYQDQV